MEKGSPSEEALLQVQAPSSYRWCQRHVDHELQQGKETPSPLPAASQTMQSPTGKFNKAIIAAHTLNSLIFQRAWRN